MSDQAHTQLQTIAALAIYDARGAVAAVKYLVTQGWTINEAFALIEQYDEFADQIKQGRFS